MSPSAGSYVAQLLQYEIQEFGLAVLLIRGTPNAVSAFEASTITRLFPGSKTIFSHDRAVPEVASKKDFRLESDDQNDPYGVQRGPSIQSDLYGFPVVHFSGHWDPSNPTYDLRWMADQRRSETTLVLWFSRPATRSKAHYGKIEAALA